MLHRRQHKRSIQLIGTTLLIASTFATSAVFAQQATSATPDNQMVQHGLSQGLILQNPDTVQFAQQAGLQEFSGQLIARPIQADALKIAGLTPAQVIHQRDVAKQIIEQHLLIEYVTGTDEYIIQIQQGETETSVARMLLQTGLFEYVEPNWIVYPLECPDDSRFNSQWHHNKMNSCNGWDIFSGTRQVIVGMCDTGVRTTHEDLNDNHVLGYNSQDRIAEIDGGSVNDVNGHGTLTTGSSSAIGNNGVGVSGMGWHLSYMPIRVTNSSGGGASISALTHGARWATSNGARVASVSYSGVGNFSVQSAGRIIMEDNHGLLVWAAGNDNSQIGIDHENVIVVGATTSSDNKASFSNYGNIIDVTAPGVDIFTTTRSNNSSYSSASGTSLSTPLVSGLVALIWSTDVEMTPWEVQDILFQGCTDIGDPGEDEIFGHGRIDVEGSMNLITGLPVEFTPHLPFQSADSYTIAIRSGDPNTLSGMFYSTAGWGETFISELGFSLDLKRAKQIGNLQTTDSNGDAEWQISIPSVPSETRVWIQALQASGRISGRTRTAVMP